MSNNSDETETDFIPRPQWFKFYYTQWAESTALFDAEQRGWYISLLMYAASQGDPPGYLPADEDDLKEIAQLKELPTGVEQLLNKLSTGNSEVLAGMELMKQKRSNKWAKVRIKFIPSKDYPGHVYNRKLLDTLKDAYRIRGFRVKAGKISAAARLSTIIKPKETNDLGTSVGTVLGQTGNNSSASVEQYRARIRVNKSNVSKSDTLPKVLMSSNEQVEAELQGLDDRIVGLVGMEDVYPEEDKKVKGIRRKSETVFEETKFKITDAMWTHLRMKYPLFGEGDWDYMVYVFITVYTGRKALSWKMTFYRFVLTQTGPMYRYKAGDYQWKAEEQVKKNEGITKSQYESTAERNARLDREADELTRQLLSGSDRDNQKHSPSFALDPNDD